MKDNVTLNTNTMSTPGSSKTACKLSELAVNRCLILFMMYRHNVQIICTGRFVTSCVDNLTFRLFHALFPLFLTAYSYLNRLQLIICIFKYSVSCPLLFSGVCLGIQQLWAGGLWIHGQPAHSTQGQQLPAE